MGCLKLVGGLLLAALVGLSLAVLLLFVPGLIWG